jgi:hypothetical protein
MTRQSLSKSAWLRTAALMFLSFSFLNGAWAAPYAIIIGGSGGDTTYQTRFHDWGGRLVSVLETKMAFPRGNIWYLAEPTETDAPQWDKETSVDNIRSVFEMASDKLGPEDDLFVFLIGHGSYQRKISKLNIPGPDLSAKDLGALMVDMKARYSVVINSTSTSAGFINELSSPNRIICTATKSTEERNATEFMEYLIQVLEEGSADLNHDERISVFEACKQAATLTGVAYDGEGLIATEHAILDDNGDGLGTRLVAEFESETRKEAALREEVSIDGGVASEVFIREFQFPADAPADLIQTYKARLASIELLIEQKDSLTATEYFTQLEALLITAAEANRTIRSYGEADIGHL